MKRKLDALKRNFYLWVWLVLPIAFVLVWLWASAFETTESLYALYLQGHRPLLDYAAVDAVGFIVFSLGLIGFIISLVTSDAWEKIHGHLFVIFLALCIVGFFANTHLNDMHREAKARLYSKDKFIAKIQHDLPQIKDHFVFTGSQEILSFVGSRAKVVFYSNPYDQHLLGPSLNAYLEYAQKYFILVYHFNDETLLLERVELNPIDKEQVVQSAVWNRASDEALLQLGFRLKD